MANSCEILIKDACRHQATEIVQLAQKEALRIEHKFSRFRHSNVIFEINNASGQCVSIDSETHLLFEFASHCFELSEGLFDVTSGVLKQLWHFKKMTQLPLKQEINNALKNIGWNQVLLKRNYITLPAEMQVDLGGIGKEYAVDRSVKLIAESYPSVDVLVNYGGDLCTSKVTKKPWKIGIEGYKDKIIHLSRGAIATSGKSKQFHIHNNIRYSHLINPKTGWPIQGSPLSITVLAESASQAGMLATLAQLKGKKWQEFLDEQNVSYWYV